MSVTSSSGYVSLSAVRDDAADPSIAVAAEGSGRQGAPIRHPSMIDANLSDVVGATAAATAAPTLAVALSASPTAGAGAGESAIERAKDAIERAKESRAA